jgi:hypothetical protein
MSKWDTHFDAIYASDGVPAVLTLGNTDADAVELTVMDHTSGIEVADGFGVFSLKPVVDVRNSELSANAIDREDLDGASLTLDGTVWTIRTHGLRFQEVRLYLSA